MKRLQLVYVLTLLAFLGACDADGEVIDATETTSTTLRAGVGEPSGSFESSLIPESTYEMPEMGINSMAHRFFDAANRGHNVRRW